MKICNNCNKTFTDDKAFCDNCGAPLSYAGMPANENKGDTVKKKLKVAIVVISVLAVFSVIYNVILYGQYRREQTFYQEYIGLVNAGKGNYYHKLDCEDFDETSSFWGYTVDLAKNKGYSPCPKCH